MVGHALTKWAVVAVLICALNISAIDALIFPHSSLSQRPIFHSRSNGEHMLRHKVFENTNLRLRGGKRDIPVEMQIFHWWDTSPWSWVIIGLAGASFVYVLPGVPKINKLNPVLINEGIVGSALLLVGVMLVLAAPVIQDYLGSWTLGFAPISETIVLMGFVLVAHAIGETIAEARDQALEEDTIDPYKSSFESNYRWKG